MEGGEVKLHSLYLWDDEVQVLRKNGDLKHRRKLVRSGIADELAAESGKSEK